MAKTSQEQAARSGSVWSSRSLWMCVAYIAIAMVLSIVLLSNLVFDAAFLSMGWT